MYFAGPHQTPFAHHPITRENAITPAVSNLSLSFRNFPGAMLGTSKVVSVHHNPDSLKPVTVHDVIRAISQQMQSDLDDGEYKWMISRLYGEHEDGWLTDVAVEERQTRRNLAGMMEFDGCERYWDGIREIKIVGGQVRLMVREFKVVEKEVG